VGCKSVCGCHISNNAKKNVCRCLASVVPSDVVSSVLFPLTFMFRNVMPFITVNDIKHFLNVSFKFSLSKLTVRARRLGAPISYAVSKDIYFSRSGEPKSCHYNNCTRRDAPWSFLALFIYCAMRFLVYQRLVVITSTTVLVALTLSRCVSVSPLLAHNNAGTAERILIAFIIRLG
jgi:hypothetical protein